MMMKRKHILIINGGLGNQMFQYAFMLQLRKMGFPVVIDISLCQYSRSHYGYELESVFGIKEPIICRKGIHLLWLRFLLKYKPPQLVSVEYCNTDSNKRSFRHYIVGYWQNERYFKDVRDHVRNHFVFTGIDKRNLKIAERIRLCNSISVHIRRGDYVTSGMLIMGDDYYSRAFNFINNHVNKPVFYVFTDDKKEAEKIVSIYCSDYILIDWNRELSSYKDMFLMSQCHHHIVANSSFSWWGAWLDNKGNSIVVAPKRWVKDENGVCPQSNSWIKI